MSPEFYDFLKILVSVLFGMFAKSLHDFIRKKIMICREKKFILSYLKNAILILPLLKDDYKKLQVFIRKTDYSILDINKFEGFDTELLKSISFMRYYEIFNKQSNMFFEVYHMVNAIREDLPLPLHNKHIEKMRTIKNNPSKNSDSEVSQQLDICEGIIKLKLDELNLLEDRINKLINT